MINNRTDAWKIDVNLLLTKQVDREFSDKRDSWLWHAPIVNTFGHMALFVKSKRWTHVVAPFSLADWSPQCYNWKSWCQVFAFRDRGVNNASSFKLSSINFPRYRVRPLLFTGYAIVQSRTDHMRSPFWFEKQSHVTRILPRGLF